MQRVVGVEAVVHRFAKPGECVLAAAGARRLAGQPWVLSFSEAGRALHDIPELADVARQGVALKQVLHLGAQR